MTARADRHTSVWVELSHDERDILDRMKAAGAVTTDANLVRVALWSLADHFDLAMPNGVFDLRDGKGKYTRNPKIRQHEPPVPSRSLPTPSRESFVCGGKGQA